jgi:hypothetical protein
MSSSGLLRRVASVGTDVSEECSTYIIRVTRIGELGTKLGVTTNRRKLRRNIIYEECCLLGCYAVKNTRRNIPEDNILHTHRRENLKSYKYYVVGIDTADM